MSADAWMEPTQPGDHYADYCQWPYDPPAPTGGKLRQSSLFWAALDAAGAHPNLAAACRELRRVLGPFRTVYGVKLQDGRLSFEFYFYDYARLDRDLSIPTVLVNSHPEDGYVYPSIEPDDYGGSYDLTQHLIALGHRRIGYIRLNPLLLGANQRLDAFLAATRAAGIPEADLVIRLGMEGPIGREANYVYQQALEILAVPDRPTALVCGNDEMALQAYLAALSLGLRVPDNLTIVGFDDFRTVSLGLKPELTTAALPYYELGRQGADMLDQLIQGKGSKQERRVLACPVVVRGSSAAIR